MEIGESRDAAAAQRGFGESIEVAQQLTFPVIPHARADGADPRLCPNCKAGKLALRGGRPETLTLRDIIQAFVAFRDTWDFFGAENQIAADQLAVFPMEQWYLNVLAEVSPDAPITVSAFTDREGNPLTYATGAAWAIPRGAANVEAACAFMATMTEPDTWVAAATAMVWWFWPDPAR